MASETHSASSSPLSPIGMGLRGEVYEPPRLVRVRVATGRMTLGQVDANTYCTIHVHDAQYHPSGQCDFN